MRTADMNRNDRLRRGFTLVEIGIVMGLIAIVLVYAIPNLKPMMTSSKVEQSVQLLVAELRRDRQLAYENSAGNSVRVEFTRNESGYRIREGGGGWVTKNLETGCIFTGESAESVEFDANGSPVPDANVEVKISDSNGNNIRSVFILRKTGRVEF